MQLLTASHCRIPREHTVETYRNPEECRICIFWNYCIHIIKAICIIIIDISKH